MPEETLIEELFAKDRLLVRAVDWPSLMKTGHGLAYDFTQWETYREEVDNGKGTSLSSTLLVKGEKVKTFGGLGFFINADKVDAFHITKSDRGSRGDVELNDFKANQADFKTLDELALSIRQEHSQKLNEVNINMESTEAYVGLFTGPGERPRATALLAQEYYEKQTGKVLPIAIYDAQQGTLTSYSPNSNEREYLLNILKTKEIYWETTDGNEKSFTVSAQKDISSSSESKFETDKSGDNKMDTEKNYNEYLIEDLGKKEYDTSEQVKTALTTISGMLSQDNSEKTIDAVFSIVNSGYEQDSATEKDIALLTHGILKKTKPQSEEQASKVLKLCRSICLSEPNLAEDAVGTMSKVFRGFSESEKVQRECLSTLESLNAVRSTFDESTISQMDEKKTMMQNTIKAQEVKILRGDKTTWKKQVSGNTETHDNGNANTDSERFDDAHSDKGHSVADDIINKTGRNWEESREREFSERMEKIRQQIEKGTYGKDFGKGVDKDYGYGR